MQRIPSIQNEIDPLAEVLVWGEPGIETLLGLLLPKHKSLFRSYYEVLQARIEFRRMQALIESEGVTVLRARDAAAHMLQRRMIPSMPENVRELRRALRERAETFYRQYRETKIWELSTEQAPLDVDGLYRQVLADMDVVLDEDIAAYGEIGAIRLNGLLSLSRQWPLSNIFYGRDQSQVVGDQVILSSLRWQIRRPEVRVYHEALGELGYTLSLNPITDGFIEGGDLIVHNGNCYVGVGARTTLAGVLDLYRKISPTLEKNNIQLIAVINERQEEESNFFISPVTEHQQVMHLDMFWIPLSERLVMAYTDEIDQRKVARIGEVNGRVAAIPLGGFRDFMLEQGLEIFEVDAQEQANFATNLLHLGGNKLIAALSSNPRVNAELAKRGFDVKFAEITRLVGGFGAIHCMTAPVRRKTVDAGR